MFSLYFVRKNHTKYQMYYRNFYRKYYRKYANIVNIIHYTLNYSYRIFLVLNKIF